jgi:hypothetical protein
MKNDYSDYRDPIENTDGIYISITEELPYERKTEDAYLEFPKESVLAAATVPLVLPKTRTRRKRTKKDKKKKTKRGGKKRNR